MEQKFLFQVSSMDLDTLVPQVSYGLEKQVEMESERVTRKYGRYGPLQ